MVVYQALYGEYGVWVRPLSMFMEEVDRVKISGGGADTGLSGLRRVRGKFGKTAGNKDNRTTHVVNEGVRRSKNVWRCSHCSWDILQEEPSCIRL